ncbi:MAG: hypothetical protein MI864_28905 [Pseudomonadales bacterium]|nr:hypothetical protein [Pseudomonadales bacterium]
MANGKGNNIKFEVCRFWIMMGFSTISLAHKHIIQGRCMLATHQDAERRYESLREMARNSIGNELPYTDRSNIHLRGICQKALLQAKLWDNDPKRLVDWPWDSGYQDYSYRNPKRFELATWYGNTLAGLSLGRPSYAGTRLRLEFIESRPSSSPLKGRIVPITISVAKKILRDNPMYINDEPSVVGSTDSLTESMEEDDETADRKSSKRS